MIKKKSKLLADQRFIVLLVILGLIIVYMIFSQEFRKYSSVLSMLDFSYYDVLMAVGVTFPLITGGVDLSIGTGMVCYSLLAGTLVRNYNCPVIVAMLLCVIFGMCIGLLNGVLVSVMDLPPFLATLCTCMITRGIGSMMTATPWPTLKQPGGWFHSIFKLTFGSGRSATKLPIGFLWMILIVLLMEFILNHTKFGRYTIAIGSNKEATLLSGISVKKYHIAVYVVSGLFAGLAAIAYSAVVPTVQPGTGAGLELDAIGGVFVGGVSATGGYGSVIGTLLGVMVIVLLKTGLPYIGLQSNWQQIITGFVLIGAVLIDIIKKRRAASSRTS
ncbi:ABC transporter permease [Lachnoclostridium sp. Marseille-P6806]|uniref:ABC transporter permease n=1 Tax=Lachnoclostridium sp. Marseille-P6806 TaxID=2364793 RepID=UPI0010322682|nr:ABC transporter permease [Lachnoclostridium sp. Marseille-P6806]